jgi:hypothetical protein
MAKSRSSYLRGAVFNPMQQAIAIRSTYPGFQIVRTHPALQVEGYLQPRALSPSYRVSILLRQPRVPEVRVLSPELQSNAPHRYKDGSLCLYWPVEWKWRDDQNVAKTLLPWAALWLYFYELWLDTGLWMGPSSHAEGGRPKDPIGS